MELTKQEQEILDGIILDRQLVGSNDSVQTKSHNCESLFDIQPGSTEVLVPTVQPRVTQTVRCEEYDDKDAELDEQFQEVFDAAMTAYDALTEDTSKIEPKYRARNNEVAAAFLNTALAAIKEKAGHKHKKDQIVTKTKQIDTGGGSNITINMADLVKTLQKQNGSVTTSLNTPTTSTNPIEDGEIVEDDSPPPTRKMKTSGK